MQMGGNETKTLDVIGGFLFVSCSILCKQNAYDFYRSQASHEKKAPNDMGARSKITNRKYKSSTQRPLADEKKKSARVERRSVTFVPAT